MLLFRRISCAVLIAALFVPRMAVATPPGRGDLLVTDFDGSRVLIVRKQTGEVEPLLPPEGSPILLAQPGGITVGSDGTIYVGDTVSDHIVRIDPATGEQSYLYHRDFDPFGGSTYAITIDTPRALATRPGFLSGDQLYVAGSAGVSYASESFSSGWSTSVYLSEASLANVTTLAVESDLTNPNIYMATLAGLFYLRENGSCCDSYATNLQLVGTDLALRLITGVAIGGADPAGPRLYAIRTFLRESDLVCLPSGGPGLILITPPSGIEIESEGGLLRCPTLLANEPGADRFYVVDYDYTGGISARIVRIERSHPAAAWTQSILTPDLPVATTADGIAVFMPEPDAAALGWFAASALFALASARRGGSSRRPS